ncbi:HIT family protein [archaeon]|jgi:histidine triad (HIT) family protein|nr:HIT family protein [Candidatus Woesearchaeota archaeon]MBT3465444.1 HIT family protein [archaeon]MBT4352800.1 HIT family protein [archaeon]MBT4647571.1 HIT family protein [archaeon]MBT6821933.1 HIT family protein [archaeon]
MSENNTTQDVAAMQKENCIFCKIIDGEIPSKKIFEDELCLATLDINPASEGHIILLPKEHYHIMPLVPDETISHLFNIAQKLSLTLLRGLSMQGTTTFIANGAAAGQKAPHFMIHIIPRLENDGLFKIPKNHISKEDLLISQKKIKGRINLLFGLKEKSENQKKIDENNDVQKTKIKETDSEKTNDELNELNNLINDKEEKNELNKEKKPNIENENKEEKKNANLDDIANLFG